MCFLVNTDDKNNQLFKKKIFFTNKESEIFDFNMLINKFNIKVIILDLLKYEKKYIENIKKITKKKIISFHEYEDYSKFSDLIINYNFNNYKLYNSKTHLLGPKFTIFSEEIKNFSNSKNEDYIFFIFWRFRPFKFIK